MINKTAKFLITLILGIIGFVSVAFGQTTLVNAQNSNDLDLKVQPVVDLSQGISQVRLSLSLENISEENVVDNLTIPNVWQVDSLISGADGSNVGISQSEITIDLVNSPLRPGETKEFQLRFLATDLLVENFWKRIEIGGINNIEPQQIIYPSSWGEPRFVNLPEADYELVSNFGEENNPENSSIIINKNNQLEIYWQTGNSLTASYEFSDDNNLFTGQDSKVIFPVLISSVGQSIDFDNTSDINSLYNDEQGNFWVEPAGGSIELKINLNKLDLEKIDKKEPTHFRFDKLNFEPPRNVLNQVSLQNPTFSEVINEVKSNFRISNYEPSVFQQRESELFSDPENLNYLEYLLLIQYLGMEFEDSVSDKSRIIYLKRDFLGANNIFMLERCNVDLVTCNYYLLDKAVNERLLYPEAPPGLQMIAFSGFDFTVFEALSSQSIFDWTISRADATSITSENNNVDTPVRINLALPDDVIAFKDFSATVEVENIGTEIIFLNELIIASREFPIVDQGYGGFHEGILPGETKNFTIDNVYLSEFFLEQQKRIGLDLAVNYYSVNDDYVYETTQSALIRQNNLFFLTIMTVFVVILVILLILILLIDHNRLLIQGAYWEQRRRISELGWILKKNVGKYFTRK